MSLASGCHSCVAAAAQQQGLPLARAGNCLAAEPWSTHDMRHLNTLRCGSPDMAVPCSCWHAASRVICWSDSSMQSGQILTCKLGWAFRVI